MAERCVDHLRRSSLDYPNLKRMKPHEVLRSIALFFVAGLLEIGGGYLVWLWLREGRGMVLGALGGLLLFLYGILPTLQPAHFSRVYAAYGGVFVVLSILWGWFIDDTPPDGAEVVGSIICLVGVAIIMYWPRS
jgi:small multidrug resistance family-3 protein